MAYTNMGRYVFETGEDQTGENPFAAYNSTTKAVTSLTSVLPTNTINVPVFELYRLMIDLTAISVPGATVVQSAQGSTSSANTLVLTFPNKVTPGDAVFVIGQSFGTTATSTVPSASDNSILALDGFITAAIGGWSSVTITTTGTGGIWAQIYELPGPYISAATSTSASGTTGTSFSSGASKASPYTDNLWLGNVGVIWSATGGTITYPGAPWGTAPLAGFSNITVAGDIVSGNTQFAYTTTIGQTETYAGTFSTATNLVEWFAEVAPYVPLFPAAFQIAVNGTVWDQQMTTAGTATNIGFTFDPQQPLILRPGDQIQIFWDIASGAATNANLGQLINVYAWFRYDEDQQPTGAS
jgi:hypothetical protein